MADGAAGKWLGRTATAGRGDGQQEGKGGNRRSPKRQRQEGEEEDQDDREEQMGDEQQERGFRRPVNKGDPKGKGSKGGRIGRNQHGPGKSGGGRKGDHQQGGGYSQKGKAQNVGNLQAQVNALRNEMKDHRTILIGIDRSVKGLEGSVNTCGFLPYEDEWAWPIYEKAEEWRTTVKEGRERDLISPEVHIGSTLVGQLTQFLEDETAKDADESLLNDPLISMKQIEMWQTLHDSIDPADLADSLEMIHVQWKGPRVVNGEEQDEEDRVMIKFRPSELAKPLWTHVIKAWKKEIVRRGGYISYKQPAQPRMRALMEKASGSRSRGSKGQEAGGY